MEVTVYDGKIGVAVSGGADSMALLHLYRLAGANICVINFEHGIRGESSVSDSRFVTDFCEKNNIECLAYRLDTVGESQKSGESIELTARKLRYGIFEGLLEHKKVDYIALAHHANDLAETVFMRILRGTGIKGLVGIRDRGRYIHPLLKYTREQIDAYVAQNEIPFVVDSTNFETEYTRNFIRNEIFPLILTRYPDYCKAFTRLSENCMEADDYFTANAVIAKEENGVFTLTDILERPIIVAKYSITATLAKLGLIQDVEQRHLEYALSLAEKPNNTTIDLAQGVVATRHNSDLLFYKKIPQTDFYQPFNVNNTYNYGGYEYTFCYGDTLINGISVDYEKLPADCVVRNCRAGDRFKRVNGYTKKLSDYFNGEKMSKVEKEEALVLAKGSEVYAIMGVETSDYAKIDGNTKQILHILRRKGNYDEE